MKTFATIVLFALGLVTAGLGGVPPLSTNDIPRCGELKDAIDKCYRTQGDTNRMEIVTSWNVLRYEASKNPSNSKDTNLVIRARMRIAGKVETGNGEWKDQGRADVQDYWILRDGKWQYLMTLVP